MLAGHSFHQRQIDSCYLPVLPRDICGQDDFWLSPHHTGFFATMPLQSWAKPKQGRAGPNKLGEWVGPKEFSVQLARTWAWRGHQLFTAPLCSSATPCSYASFLLGQFFAGSWNQSHVSGCSRSSHPQRLMVQRDTRVGIWTFVVLLMQW